MVRRSWHPGPLRHEFRLDASADHGMALHKPPEEHPTAPLRRDRGNARPREPGAPRVFGWRRATNGHGPTQSALVKATGRSGPAYPGLPARIARPLALLGCRLNPRSCADDSADTPSSLMTVRRLNRTLGPAGPFLERTKAAL